MSKKSPNTHQAKRRRKTSHETPSGSAAGDQFRAFLIAVKNYIFLNHRFPQVADISRITEIPRRRCSSICETLVGQRQLYVCFEGPKMPKVVLPYNMMEAVLRTQSRPAWIQEYEYPEKRQYVDKMNALEKRLIELEQFEGLLYLTDIPLEQSVAHCLNWLGFANVMHHKDDRDNPDVTFEHDGIYALAEVEGPSGSADKDKVQQLRGWLERAVVQNDKKSSQLQAFLIVNHFREDDPAQRAEPLTDHAKEFLRLFKGKLVTTFYLYNLATQVRQSKLTREQAMSQVWQGEPF